MKTLEGVIDAGGRTQARREILEAAHEGHEEYRSPVRIRRVGPRRYMSMSESGYDYLESLGNWHPSKWQIVGFLVILAFLAALLTYLVLASQ